MNIERELEKEGIKVIGKLDSLISNDIAKNVSRRIYESFPEFNFTINDLYSKLSKLNMYRAIMPEGMAEANYYYKNKSIYFNEHIEFEDLEEFAIHECIHYLQEIEDENNKLIKMGLSTYNGHKTSGLGLNEAATQLMASYIIGIEPDFEKYYGISLTTPSPSYYPIECALLNEITYFTGTDVLFKSTLFATDEFKDCVISLTSENVYSKLLQYFDTILQAEESIVKLSNKTDLYEDGNSKIDKINEKINKFKIKIANIFVKTQNLIIEEFFNNDFSKITNLEELENFRHRLCKFSEMIGTVEGYTFFDNYYTELMNKLEHKCNVLENGGQETALKTKSNHYIIEFFKKLFGWALKNEA